MEYQSGMGPLYGVRVVEVAALGPGPFAAMVLSDLGAEVIRVDRVDAVGDVDLHPEFELLNRGRRSIAIDLKQPAGLATLLELVGGADAILEGFRPGVAERLGFGPEVCLGLCPRLVYGRITGWGQTGSFSHAAGHDINYISLAGALEPLGRVGEKPAIPLNLLGDFGGGGMLLALGVVSALFEAQRSNKGQVVDAAMVDGAALLTTMIHGFRALGSWHDERGTNYVDSGAHYYEVYETADGKYISVGAIEPKFYAELLDRLELDSSALPDQLDETAWPAMKELLADLFRHKTRDQWCELLEYSDACFAPVLSMAEAPEHPHLRERNTYVEVAGVVQPAPAPRFSRTSPTIQRPPSLPGQHTEEILVEIGFDSGRIAALRESGVVN